MAKGYWITCLSLDFRPCRRWRLTPNSPDRPDANGGRFLARGGTVKTYEQGVAQRTVLLEFDRC